MKRFNPWQACSAVLFVVVCLLLARDPGAAAQNQPTKDPPKEPAKAALKGWKAGEGWGWVWGEKDEVGSLNSMTPATTLAALSLAKEGKVFDLGVTYSRHSFKWPGHSGCEI